MKRLLESETEPLVGRLDNLYKLQNIVCECFTSLEVHMNYSQSRLSWNSDPPYNSSRNKIEKMVFTIQKSLQMRK